VEGEGEKRDKIRVAIVDDHEVVRAGLKTMIERQPDMVVAVEAATAAEAIRRIPGQTDVAVLDIRLPDQSGIEVCRQVKAADPSVHVIMLTSFGDDEVLFQSLTAGAAGYLLKETRARAVIDAIRTVASGGSLLDPGVAERVLRRLQAGQAATEASPLDQLSPQERRILELIAEGKTNKEIGEIVYLSDKTVKHYVSNILNKLGMSRRSEAAAWLARHEKK
jgi:two-component system response regulator DevR